MTITWLFLILGLSAIRAGPLSVETQFQMTLPLTFKHKFGGKIDINSKSQKRSMCSDVRTLLGPDFICSQCEISSLIEGSDSIYATVKVTNAYKIQHYQAIYRDEARGRAWLQKIFSETNTRGCHWIVIFGTTKNPTKVGSVSITFWASFEPKGDSSILVMESSNRSLSMCEDVKTLLGADFAAGDCTITRIELHSEIIIASVNIKIKTNVEKYVQYASDRKRLMQFLIQRLEQNTGKAQRWTVTYGQSLTRRVYLYSVTFSLVYSITKQHFVQRQTPEQVKKWMCHDLKMSLGSEASTAACQLHSVYLQGNEYMVELTLMFSRELPHHAYLLDDPVGLKNYFNGRITRFPDNGKIGSIECFNIRISNLNTVTIGIYGTLYHANKPSNWFVDYLNFRSQLYKTNYNILVAKINEMIYRHSEKFGKTPIVNPLIHFTKRGNKVHVEITMYVMKKLITDCHSTVEEFMDVILKAVTDTDPANNIIKDIEVTDNRGPTDEIIVPATPSDTVLVGFTGMLNLDGKAPTWDDDYLDTESQLYETASNVIVEQLNVLLESADPRYGTNFIKNPMIKFTNQGGKVHIKVIICVSISSITYVKHTAQEFIQTIQTKVITQPFVTNVQIIKNPVLRGDTPKSEEDIFVPTPANHTMRIVIQANVGDDRPAEWTQNLTKVKSTAYKNLYRTIVDQLNKEFSKHDFGSNFIDKPSIKFFLRNKIVLANITINVSSEKLRKLGKTMDDLNRVIKLLTAVGPAKRKRCYLEKDKGRCKAKMVSYWYNHKAGKCEEFVFGCEGNENRFDTEQECTDACANPKICQLQKDDGPCKALHPRYWYNSVSKKCEFFQYGGCQGNENNFEEEEECQKLCESVPGTGVKPIPRPKPNLCYLDKDGGPCKASFIKYWYNSKSENCEAFIYGGCRGNENNFGSMKECMHICGDKTMKPTPEPGTQSVLFAFMCTLIEKKHPVPWQPGFETFSSAIYRKHYTRIVKQLNIFLNKKDSSYGLNFIANPQIFFVNMDNTVHMNIIIQESNVKITVKQHGVQHFIQTMNTALNENTEVNEFMGDIQVIANPTTGGNMIVVPVGPNPPSEDSKTVSYGFMSTLLIDGRAVQWRSEFSNHKSEVYLKYYKIIVQQLNVLLVKVNNAYGNDFIKDPTIEFTRQCNNVHMEVLLKIAISELEQIRQTRTDFIHAIQSVISGKNTAARQCMRSVQVMNQRMIIYMKTVFYRMQRTTTYHSNVQFVSGSRIGNKHVTETITQSKQKTVSRDVSGSKQVIVSKIKQ